MSQIETLYKSGLDALSNLFEVQFNLPTDVSAFFPNLSGTTGDRLTFRVQDFSIPSAEASTYQVEWGPFTFDRPNSKVNSTRTTTMTIRVDKGYEIYQGFINWKNSIQNEYTGVVSAFTDNNVTDLIVYPVTTSVGDGGDYVPSTVGDGIKFEKCWPSSIGEISYSQSSGDPIALSITWTFLRISRDFNTESGSSEEQGASDPEETN